MGHDTRVTKRNRCIRVLKPFSLFSPLRPRPGMRTGCRESPGSTCPRRGATWGGMGRHGRRPSPALATRPVRFFTRHGLSRSPAARHFFWSEPDPSTMVFANHETRTLSPLGSPWVRKGRTIRNPRPYRRARRPVATFLRVVVRHWAAWAAYCPRSRCPRAVSRRSRRPPGCFRSGNPNMNPC